MKRTSALCILLILGAFLAGCASNLTPEASVTAEPAVETTPVATQETFPLEMTDGLGRSITLDQPAQRIVSLAPSATEILYAVGAGSQVVGRDSFSDYPEEVLDIQDVGGSMGNYSLEMIASLNPDLVLATEIHTAEQVKSLEDLGLTVYYILNPTDLEGLYPILENVALLTGHEAEAAELVHSLKTRVDSVTARIEKAETRPVVFYEMDGSDPAKPWTSGPGTFVDILIQLAGGQNLGSGLTTEWAQISVEEIMVKDPDLIVLGDSIYGTTPEMVASRVGWEELKAVKENQIYEFDDDLVSRPGPRMVDGLEELAKMIHPELY